MTAGASAALELFCMVKICKPAGYDVKHEMPTKLLTSLPLSIKLWLLAVPKSLLYSSYFLSLLGVMHSPKIKEQSNVQMCQLS